MSPGEGLPLSAGKLEGIRSQNLWLCYPPLGALGPGRRLGKGTDGEGMQRAGERRVRRGRLAPGLLCCRPACCGRQNRLRCRWLGPCCCPVWENWQWLQTPQKPQPPPCPCCLPQASPSLRGAPLPICSSLLDTWPFCFCLGTTEGAFQLPRNVLEEET